MLTVTSLIARVTVATFLLAGIFGFYIPVYAQALDSDQSQFSRDQNEGFWVVLPERVIAPRTIESKYKFLGYALYDPALIQNDVCITRMVQIGFASERDKTPQIVNTAAVIDFPYLAAIRKASSNRECSEMDFEHEYFRISQPIKTDTLLELRRLVLSIGNDERAKAVSEGRSLEGLKISTISVNYSREYGDLAYRLSVRDEDGPVLSISIARSLGALKVMMIRGLAN